MCNFSPVKRSLVAEPRPLRYCDTPASASRELLCHYFHTKAYKKQLCARNSQPFYFQTSPWRSSCGAYRRSVPVRCAWIKRSTLSSSPVDIWWCAKNVHRHWGSVRSAEAWSRAPYGPSSHNSPGLCHRSMTEYWSNLDARGWLQWNRKHKITCSTVFEDVSLHMGPYLKSKPKLF